MTRSLPILALLLAGAAAADPHADIVQRAFDAISTDYDDHWAYSEAELKDGRLTVGRYDPRGKIGARWTLESVDGRPPSDAERVEYAARRTREDGGDSGDGGRDDHATIVRPGTLELVEESDDAWHFAFEPADDEDEESREFMRHVEGRLVVRKSGHYVETISLRNEKPIRPMPGVKISTFETLIEFGPAVPGGPIVPRSIDVRVRGRAFLAIGFDETESIRFSAWEYAGRAE